MTTANSNALKIGAAILGALVVHRLIAGPSVDPYIDDPPHVDVDPTITAEQAQLIAETVAAAIYAGSTFWSGWPFGSLFEDEALVIAAMTNEMIRNDADVLLVVDQYGIRGQFATPDLTLPQAIRRYLEPSDVEQINDAYQARGINLRF